MSHITLIILPILCWLVLFIVDDDCACTLLNRIELVYSYCNISTVNYFQ